MSDSKPLTQHEKDQKLAQALEDHISQIVELLAMRKSSQQHWNTLVQKKIETSAAKNEGPEELSYMCQGSLSSAPESCLVVVHPHIRKKMELIDMYKTHHKFLRHPDDLHGRLDELTDEYLRVLHRMNSHIKVENPWDVIADK